MKGFRHGGSPFLVGFSHEMEVFATSDGFAFFQTEEKHTFLLLIRVIKLTSQHAIDATHYNRN
jgi:hypothetical protein